MKSDNLHDSNIVKTAIIGGIIFLLTGFIAVLMFAVLIYFAELGDAMAPLFATISVAIGIMVSSYWIAKRTGKKGFLIGLIIGLSVFSLVTVISLIADDGAMTLNTLFHLVIFVLSGLVGGILGVNKPNKKYI